MRDEWWYAIHGVKQGPVKFEELKQRLLHDTLSPDDLVWTAGMPQWIAVHEVPALQALLQSLQPPDLPPPAPFALPPELPKPGRPELHGSFVVTEPMPLETPAPKPELAGPWRRLLARQLDFCIFGLPTIFLVSYEFARVSPEFGLWIQRPQAGAALFVLLLPLILVLETIIFERFETTPGKSLLGIHIATVNAQTLTWEQYLKRQFFLYGSGLGIGFPLISLFTMARQYVRLKSGKKASYDEGLYQVTAKKISVARYVFVTLLICVLVVTSAVIQMIDGSESRKNTSLITLPPVSNTQKHSTTNTQPPTKQSETEEERLTREHKQKIYAAHPDVQSILNTENFKKFIDSSENNQRISQNGTADEVINMISAYKARYMQYQIKQP